MNGMDDDLFYFGSNSRNDILISKVTNNCSIINEKAVENS